MADLVVSLLDCADLPIPGRRDRSAGLSQATYRTDDTRLQQTGEKEGHGEQRQEHDGGDDPVLREPGPEGRKLGLKNQPTQPLALVSHRLGQCQPVVLK
jgi:hypothetical protein